MRRALLQAAWSVPSRYILPWFLTTLKRKELRKGDMCVLKGHKQARVHGGDDNSEVEHVGCETFYQRWQLQQLLKGTQSWLEQIIEGVLQRWKILPLTEHDTQEQTYGSVSLRTKTVVWENLKGKKRGGISLWERQRNNEVKLEQHHVVTLVEFRQDREYNSQSCLVWGEKGRMESVTVLMKFCLVGFLAFQC